MKLENSDRKYWEPQKPVIDWLLARIKPSDKVLEIGPGHAPFPRANEFVDLRELPNVPKDKTHNIDLNQTPLPYPDKAFDFIYCRHVIEDMHNPFMLLEEMQRVGKAGYIELPSPAAELCRGVDGNSPPFRGYHHHHYIGWTCGNELRLIAKYPIIEYLVFDEEALASALREGPEHWNTHYLWEDKINWKHRRNGQDYILTRDYAPMLYDAFKNAKGENLQFWNNMKLGKAA